MLCGSVEERRAGKYMAEVRTSSQSERPCAGIEETRKAPRDAGGYHLPSTETTTQESGLRENRTSRLSERTEAGRKPDLLRLYRDEGAVMVLDRRGCGVQPWPAANR